MKTSVAQQARRRACNESLPPHHQRREAARRIVSSVAAALDAAARSERPLNEHLAVLLLDCVRIAKNSEKEGDGSQSNHFPDRP